MIEHARRQHPVGQGFFHSGEVRADGTGEALFRYVYDCGEFREHHDARNREIANLVERWGPRTVVDIVFISHIDADHVNGLKALFDPVAGLTPAVFILPQVTPLQRLVMWCEALARGGLQNDFFDQFVADPETTLVESFPGVSVLTVTATDATSPDSFEERILDVPGVRDQGGTPRWTLRSDPTSAESSHTVSSGSQIVVGRAQQDDPVWILVPHVAQHIASGRQRFIELLALRMGLTPSQLEDNLSDARFLLDLITKKATILRNTFRDTAPSTNATSLSLYSGPDIAAESWTSLRYGRDQTWHAGGPRVGWLGTGDAELSDETGSLINFLETFRRFFPLVRTVSTPHHGSSRNRIPVVWEELGPGVIAVTAADPPTKWRHPSTEVMHDLARHGIEHFIVSSAEASALDETVRLG
jgi:hypothetical protein